MASQKQGCMKLGEELTEDNEMQTGDNILFLWNTGRRENERHDLRWGWWRIKKRFSVKERNYKLREKATGEWQTEDERAYEMARGKISRSCGW